MGVAEAEREVGDARSGSSGGWVAAALRVGFSFALALGCAGSYWQRHRAAFPDGWEPQLAEGRPLDAVLGALRRPVRGRYGLQVARLTVFRADVEPWARVPSRDVGRVPFEAEPGADYAAVVVVECRGKVNFRVRARRWGWYMLPQGRLVAWDHPAFGERCASDLEYRPASPACAAFEARLVEQARAWAGEPKRGALELYDRAWALLQVGRVEDAREMLAWADQVLGYADGAPAPYTRTVLVDALESAAP